MTGSGQDRPIFCPCTLKVPRSALGSGSGRPEPARPMSQLGPNLPVPGPGREGLESAQPRRCRSLRRGSLNRTYNGHSGPTAGTGLHAPKPSFRVGIDLRAPSRNALPGQGRRGLAAGRNPAYLDMQIAVVQRRCGAHHAQHPCAMTWRACSPSSAATISIVSP
jgi:hypothetical protein